MHLNLEDSVLDHSQSNRDILSMENSSEPNTFIDDLTMETKESVSRDLKSLEDQPNFDDFSTLEESNLQEQLDKINDFACCEKVFTNFDSFDRHVENHMLESPTKRKSPNKSNSSYSGNP